MSNELISRIRSNIESAVLGKEETIRMATVALLAGGHVLLEDAPGLGKTSLARAFARTLGCEFSRLQFTPDLLPSDILGVNIFRPDAGEFEFRQGPVFTNVLLADEINRTTPRTQSALLEAMSEGRASIDGQTYELPAPFLVIATQNPYEFEGTYPLPENQLDRFMMCLSIGYPPREVEREVLKSHRTGQPVDRIQAVATAEELIKCRQAVQEVAVDDAVTDYLLSIVDATRSHQEITLGVSTRGALTLYRAIQANALVHGRDYTIPDDVKELCGPVLAHRIQCRSAMREGQRTRAHHLLQGILETVSVPT